ncbi:hypothetical protein C8F04DRAFT_1291565 [Mycena alexandri]|uniref:Uncharacterized protein n=1 Tax=Mycena alexandri TaxID=1745969 RepID=A0AAD6WWT9_9AGAR|nr:hypothetical protein C8F04DRAFT_1291565 [Mycena alexandri]
MARPKKRTQQLRQSARHATESRERRIVDDTSSDADLPDTHSEEPSVSNREHSRDPHSPGSDDETWDFDLGDELPDLDCDSDDERNERNEMDDQVVAAPEITEESELKKFATFLSDAQEAARARFISAYSQGLNGADLIWVNRSVRTQDSDVLVDHEVSGESRAGRNNRPKGPRTSHTKTNPHREPNSPTDSSSLLSNRRYRHNCHPRPLLRLLPHRLPQRPQRASHPNVVRVNGENGYRGAPALSLNLYSTYRSSLESDHDALPAKRLVLPASAPHIARKAQPAAAPFSPFPALYNRLYYGARGDSPYVSCARPHSKVSAEAVETANEHNKEPHDKGQRTSHTRGPLISGTTCVQPHTASSPYAPTSRRGVRYVCASGALLGGKEN